MTSAGTVLEVGGGVYRVLREDGVEVSASLRGRLKQVARSGGRVVPGDRVLLSSPDGTGDGVTIEDVLPRENELVRAGAQGRGEKIVAANVDRCVVVLSATDPPFRREAADRFLVLAEISGIPPVLVLNKIDLLRSDPGIATDVALYERIGYQVFLTSTVSGEGCASLAALLSEGVSLLMGPSGVGKSSLLNALDPGFVLRVGEVGRMGRGKHTTVGAVLLPLSSGGWVVDTPGFSDAALTGVDLRELGAAFPEMVALADECRFSGCSHLHEPGCAVRDAVKEGGVDPVRYESYRSLAAELGNQ